MTRPVVPLYAVELGAGSMEVGMLASIYSFLPLLLAVRAGKLVDRTGDRLPLFLGLCCFLLGMTAPSLAAALWALMFSQVIVGMSNLFGNLTLQNTLGRVSTPQNRDHLFGIYSVVVSFSNFLGPVAGGYISQHMGYPAVFMTAGVLGIGLVAMMPFLPGGKPAAVRKEPAETGSVAGSLALLRSSPLRAALISSGLVVYSRDIFVAYFPLYGQHIGLSDSAIGWIIAIQGLAMMPIRLYLSRLVRWMGRERLLIATILLAGATFVLIPAFGQVSVLMALSTLMGFGLGCGQPLSMSTIYTVSPKNRTGEVLGLRLATNRLFQLAVPFLFGLLGKWVGIASVFYGSGLLLFGGAYLSRTGPQENRPEENRPDDKAEPQKEI